MKPSEITREIRRHLFSPPLSLVLFGLLLVLPFIIRSRILVLLVLCHQIIHVALCLSELHLVHPFPGVPMQEGLPPKHSCELLAHPPEHLLDGSRVPDESGGHLQPPGWDVAHR
ncbi:unnamed protein product [Linum tenue]|uniref:Uncharacterized protein n=1 Tax=Linum tenue TaxID=586396 RepID=A0AAV0HCL2_9ROSI|nr:unnamed protein product [Linum tenue]